MKFIWVTSPMARARNRLLSIMLFYVAVAGAFSHGQNNVEGDVFGGTDLGGGWVFSEWYGIYNASFYPWIFHNEHGWQYVIEGGTDGEFYLHDLQSEDWWFTSELLYPSFFSFGRRTWNWFFEETVNPRQFVDLESGGIWRDISERAALEALYEATGGPNWDNRSNWRTDLPLGEWHGVRVDDQGRVISINLSDNKLTGQIPGELGSLDNLQDLFLADNDLTGEIPAELGSLVNLQYLYLYDNDLTGEIPVELSTLVKLEDLDLSNNRLTGEIPVELGKLANLRYLGLSGNKLTGEIPEELGLLPLQYLALSDNNLTGEIPGQLGLLANLVYLYLDGNGLTGEIPGVLGSLAYLESLYLNDNNLMGEIPRELGSLHNLQDLDLSGNSLTGEIPDGLSGSLDNLQYISERAALLALYKATGGPDWDNRSKWWTNWPLKEWHGVDVDDQGRVFSIILHNNNLTGEIPGELGKLANLQRLYLYGNALTGEIPGELGKLDNLQDLNLSFNRLTGEIPGELGSLAYLRHVYLRGNNLMGEIPRELGKLANLQDLNLSFNRLAGEIPAELGSLAYLESLYLNDNKLTGEIPGELGSLAYLRHVYFHNNSLTGEIPAELGSMDNLQYLDLRHNRLTGEIPGELGTLVNLQDLDLSGNSLTGEIPGELGSMDNLQYLILANNNLTGGIPPALGEAELLSTIDVSKNPGMSGELPARLTNLRQLGSFLAHDTGLCAPSDAIFQDWLAGVWKRRVIACSAGDPPSFYLTQAVQSREFTVPLVSGEDALLRVFVTTTRATDESLPPVRARFYLNGAENYAVDIPGKSHTIPNEVKEGDLSASANVKIPGRVVQPGLEMVIDVDPEGTLVYNPGVTRRRIPEHGRWAVDVREMPLFELTVIPFQQSANQDSSILELVRAMAQDPEGHSLLWETRTLLPVADLVVTAHPSVLTSSDNAHDLLSETEAIRVMEGASGHYLGMMTAGSIDGSQGTAYLGEWSSFSIAHSSVIAHELGHNLGLRHPPGCEAENTDPSFPYPGGRIGVWGYNFRGHGGLVSPRRHDLMSYCRHQGREWISDYHFTNALEYRLRPADAGELSSQDARPARSLLLWGGVDIAGAPFLEPAFVVDAPPALPRSTGEYEIIGRTAGGAELFSLSLEMPEVAGGDGRSSFALALPVQPEWDGQLARITLSGPGGSFTLDGQTNRPVTILRNPRNGQIRGILRDVTPTPLAPGGTTPALSLDPAWERLTSRGIGGEALFLETPELIGQ